MRQSLLAEFDEAFLEWAVFLNEVRRRLGLEGLRLVLLDDVRRRLGLEGLRLVL